MSYLSNCWLLALDVVETVETHEFGVTAQFIFDLEQAVVFADTVGS